MYSITLLSEFLNNNDPKDVKLTINYLKKFGDYGPFSEEEKEDNNLLQIKYLLDWMDSEKNSLKLLGLFHQYDMDIQHNIQRLKIYQKAKKRWLAFFGGNDVHIYQSYLNRLVSEWVVTDEFCLVSQDYKQLMLDQIGDLSYLIVGMYAEVVSQESLPYEHLRTLNSDVAKN